MSYFHSVRSYLRDAVLRDVVLRDVVFSYNGMSYFHSVRSYPQTGLTHLKIRMRLELFRKKAKKLKKDKESKMVKLQSFKAAIFLDFGTAKGNN